MKANTLTLWLSYQGCRVVALATMTGVGRGVMEVEVSMNLPEDWWLMDRDVRRDKLAKAARAACGIIGAWDERVAHSALAQAEQRARLARPLWKGEA